MAKSLPIEALRIELLESYKALVTALQTFGHCVLTLDQALPAWVQPLEEDPPGWSHRQAAVDVFQRLLMTPSQDPKQCVQRFGAIGASAQTLEAARDVNAVKKRLAAAYKAIKESEREASLEQVYDCIVRTPLLKKALHQGGLTGLHVVQATRQIHLLPVRPRKIGFTLCRRSSSVQRLDYETALRKAERAGHADAVATIRAYGPGQAFAIVRRQAPHVRANLSYDGAVAGSELPRQKLCSMPLLFPAAPGEAMPLHNGPRTLALLGLDEDMARERRNDSQLALEAPVSEALHLYAYKPDSRDEVSR